MQRCNRLPALVLFALCATGAGSMLNVPSAWAVVQRAVKLIGGTGVTVSASDNATTGQQEWTVNSTVTGGVSSVTGAGTVSCSPTTGAVTCTGTGSAVSSVTGAGATSCSPTTGAVVCTTPSVTLSSGSGIAVTGGPAYTVALGVPVATVNGGTEVTSSGANGNVLTSNGTKWVSASGAAQTSAQFSEHASGSSSFTISNSSWTTLASFTVTVGTGQLVLLHGAVECLNSTTAGSYNYGVGVDVTTLTSVNHRADIPVSGVYGDGAMEYLASGLSAGSHTINFLAGFATSAGDVCGWSAVVQVLGS